MKRATGFGHSLVAPNPVIGRVRVNVQQLRPRSDEVAQLRRRLVAGRRGKPATQNAEAVDTQSRQELWSDLAPVPASVLMDEVANPLVAAPDQRGELAPSTQSVTA